MKRSLHYHRLADPFIMIVVALVFFFIFLVTDSLIINTVFVSYFLLTGLSHIYVRLSAKVMYRLSQEQLRLFIDDTATLQLTLHNTSKLPLINASFRFRSQPGVTWDSEQLQNIGKEYKIPFVLKAQEEKSIDLEVRATKRGKVTCDEVGWTISDPFNLVVIHIEANSAAFPVFYVYPKLLRRRIPSAKKLRIGTRRAIVSPLYDETKILGIKPYENEAFRSIHWGATAKTGQVSAKKYEPNQISSYAIYLNLTNPSGFTFRNDIEQLIELAAGTCYELVANHCSFEFSVNCLREKGIIHIPYGGGRKQLQAVLIALSTLTESENIFPPHLFFSTRLHKKTPGAIPLIIGNSPSITKYKSLRLDVQGM